MIPLRHSCKDRFKWLESELLRVWEVVLEVIGEEIKRVLTISFVLGNEVGRVVIIS